MKVTVLSTTLLAGIMVCGCNSPDRPDNPSAAQGTLKMAQPNTATSEVSPIDMELPLDSKAAAVACGSVMQLDQAALARLNLLNRLSQLVSDIGFTDQELKEFRNSDELQEGAFSAYALAYQRWREPLQLARKALEKRLDDAVTSLDLTDLSTPEKQRMNLFLVKLTAFHVKAFQLGRRDARTSPCSF